MSPTVPVAITAAALLLLGACASTSQPRQARAECQALLAQIASSEEDKRAAEQKQKEAPKTVVPFLVSARYASSQSALGAADDRIGHLQTEFERRGCTQISG